MASLSSAMQMIMKPNNVLVGRFYGETKDVERFGGASMSQSELFYDPHFLINGQSKRKPKFEDLVLQ